LECAYCREEIVTGAKLCRFCRKRQPLSDRESRARRERYRPFFIGGAIAAVVLLIVSSCLSAQGQTDKLTRAAECAYKTYDELEAAAETSAKRSGRSVTETENEIAALVCPRLFR
jgi:hypothetical protein